jgi:hypothetical protein
MIKNKKEVDSLQKRSKNKGWEVTVESCQLNK